MAKWRRLASEWFPDLASRFRSPHLGRVENIYEFFFQLLPRTTEAIGKGDWGYVERAFAFACWCVHQTPDFHNAADVCFFEHVLQELDDRELERCMEFVEPEARDSLSSLMRWAYPSAKLSRMLKVMKARNGR